jgi:hypothetical protein
VAIGEVLLAVGEVEACFWVAAEVGEEVVEVAKLHL